MFICPIRRKFINLFIKLYIQIFAGHVGKKVILNPGKTCMWSKGQQEIISRECKNQDRNNVYINRYSL